MRRKSKNPRCRRVSLNLTEGEFETLQRAAVERGTTMTAILIEGLRRVAKSGWKDVQTEQRREIVGEIVDDLTKKYL